jgi:hypothetical protein
MGNVPFIFSNESASVEECRRWVSRRRIPRMWICIYEDLRDGDTGGHRAREKSSN